MSQSIFKCTVCGKSIFDKPYEALYRNNPKGEVPADYRCLKHCKKKPKKEEVKITSVITEVMNRGG